EQWNMAVNSFSTQDTLVVKEIPKNTTTVKIIYGPTNDLKDLLISDLAYKNGIDTSRLTVICNRDRYAVVKGPTEVLRGLIESGRAFLGLCSCKVIRLSKKGGLCYKCGKFHQLKGTENCPFNTAC
ncbi:hypothetical protein FOL47_006341, partial [Perkinsus chesapeaki]